MNKLLNKGAAVVNKYPMKVVAAIAVILLATAVVAVFWLNANPGTKDAKGIHISTTHGSVKQPVKPNQLIETNDGGGAGIGVDSPSGSEGSVVEGQASPVNTWKASAPQERSVKVSTHTESSSKPVAAKQSVPVVVDEPAPVTPVVEAPVVVDAAPVAPTVEVPTQRETNPVYVDWAYTPAGMTGSVLVAYRATPQVDNSWECAYRGGSTLVDGVAVQEWVPYGFASDVEGCKAVYISLD